MIQNIFYVYIFKNVTHACCIQINISPNYYCMYYECIYMRYMGNYMRWLMPTSLLLATMVPHQDIRVRFILLPKIQQSACN